MNTDEWLVDYQRRLTLSPHTCSEGCGARMMHPDRICNDCDERRDRQRDLDSKWRSKVPRRYQDARFDEPEILAARVSDSSAIEVARTALDQHMVVTLFGPPGAGKSTLACAVAAQWVESSRWNRGVYVTAFKLATARAEHSLGDGEPDAVDSAKRETLLVLDDVGQEPITPQSAVVEVIHHRHEHERRTIVTCAIGRKTLAERYGGGVCRRLLEGASVIDVRAKG